MLPSPQTFGDRLLHPLKRRFIGVLIGVATLVLIDQVLLQPWLLQLHIHAPLIHTAGGQRLLSQKIAKHALAMSIAVEEEERQIQRSELVRTLFLWSNAHHDLLGDGRKSHGRPINSAEIHDALLHLQSSFGAIHRAGMALCSQYPTGEEAYQLAELLRHEPAYLEGMDRVVDMLEEDAQAQVRWLRRVEFVAMFLVLSLMAVVYYGVIQPASRLIDRQVEQLAASEIDHLRLNQELFQARHQLELKVAQRTEELNAENMALRRRVSRHWQPPAPAAT